MTFCILALGDHSGGSPRCANLVPTSHLSSDSVLQGRPPSDPREAPGPARARDVDRPRPRPRCVPQGKSTLEWVLAVPR